VRLNVYLPSTGSGPWPVIIYYPGGGWVSQSEGAITPLFTNFTAAGYAVISAGYISSTIEKWPAQIRDAKAAVRWVRANAATYGFDPARIGVSGGSSGGHIAAYVGVSGGVRTARVGAEVMDLVGNVGSHFDQSDAVQAAAPIFPPTDLLSMDHYPTPGVPDHNATTSPESGLIGAGIQTVPEKTGTANPIIHVRSGLPPFWITHSTSDTLVPFNQSELLNAAMSQAAQPAVFWPVQNGGHGPGVSDSQEVITLLRTFFDRVLLGATTNALPVPRLTLSATSGTAPLTITGDASTSSDPDGVITRYTWSNGDGTGSGSATTMSYTYTRPGVYPVTVGVRDDLGGTASITQNIIVTPAGAGSSTNAPTIDLCMPADQSLLASPGSATVTSTFTTAGGSTVSSVEYWLNDQPYAWDSKTPYLCTLAGLTPGCYRMLARITDSTGNHTTSTPLEFRVLGPAEIEPALTLNASTLALDYYRRTDGTSYSFERSSDLLNWTPFTPAETTLQDGPQIQQQRATDPLSISGVERRFLRIISTPPP
jgi:acetyl esterase/lipase